MFHLLITGGCGFIGSNFIHHLLESRQDVHITNLDKLTYAGNPANLETIAADARYHFVHGDIADPATVRKAMKGVGGVIHFAAESHVDRSIHDSGPVVRPYVLGAQVLLDAAREMQLGCYVHVSTDEVYGSLGPTGMFTEETPLAPNSPYSASKAASDLLVRSYVHTFGLPAMITRCSNNYGPYQFPEKLIPLFITMLLEDRPVPVYGTGQNVRDWIHVRDHCAAIERVWSHGTPGEVYNIGGGCERTNMQITHALLEELGKPESLIRFVKDRPGHDQRYAIDSSKIRRELGWQPRISFEDGLRDTIAWYRKNTAWVESIRTGEYLRYFGKQYGMAV